MHFSLGQKDTECVRNNRRLHRNLSQPLSIGLEVRRNGRRGAAAEACYIHESEKGIEPVQVEPSQNEPERKRQQRRPAKDQKPQMRVVDICIAASEVGEQSAKIADARCHHAHSLPDSCGV